MRIRKKKWAPAELSSALFYEEAPARHRGHWSEEFKNSQNPFWVELGCGKGVSTAKLAAASPSVNILAIDIKSDVLAVAKRNVDEEFSKIGRWADNIFLTAYDIENLAEILSPRDKIQRLLINFCNPQPKARSNKHRLTHTRQLNIYKAFLTEESIISFKTDDDGLFLTTRDEYFPEAGFKILEEAWDLSINHPESQYLSEHEKKFREMGLPIHYISAALK